MKGQRSKVNSDAHARLLLILRRKESLAKLHQQHPHKMHGIYKVVRALYKTFYGLLENVNLLHSLVVADIDKPVLINSNPNRVIENCSGHSE